MSYKVKASPHKQFQDKWTDNKGRIVSEAPAAPQDPAVLLAFEQAAQAREAKAVLFKDLKCCGKQMKKSDFSARGYYCEACHNTNEEKQNSKQLESTVAPAPAQGRAASDIKKGSTMSNIVSAQKNSWATLQQQVAVAYKSDLLPKSINSVEKAIAIALKGQELGIPMMQAFSHIAIINGRPTMGGELMLSQIYRMYPSAVLNFVKHDNTECTLEATRPNGIKQTFKFTMADAKQAQLTSKDSWVKYPRMMLRWRCISEMARTMFPDAINGVSYTPEEMGAEVNEDGEIEKDVSPEKPTPPPQVAQAVKDLEETFDGPSLLESKAEMAGRYVIKFGKYKGLMLNQLKIDELDRYALWLNQNAAQKGRKPEFEAADFIAALNIYKNLLALEQESAG